MLSEQASHQIQWTVEFAVQEGKGPEFEKLANDISRLVESSEPGTTAYQFYISDDRKKSIAVERYASSEAALAHLSGAGATTILPKILGVSAITRFEVFGNPSAELQKALSGFELKNYSFLSGFAQ